MNKKVFRKILIVSIFALLLSFFLVGGNNIKATESDNMKASYMVVETKKTVRYTYTNYKVEDALTTINSTASKQTVCVFTQKQTENSKVVTWAVNKGTGFSFKTIPQIAEDYEKNHPDWFVVGGINADQYIMSQGTGGVSNGTDFLAPQPYYPMIADGESWFSVPCWPSSGGGNAAAFLQDGSTDCIVNGSMNLKSGNIKIKGLFLAVLDENGEVVNNFKIEKINEKPGDGETTVYCCYTQEDQSSGGDLRVLDMDITGSNMFICENSDLAYMNNSKTYEYWKKNGDSVDSLFCKGTLSTQNNAFTLKNGQFAIDTKNTEVLNALAVGKKVRVQIELEGVFSEVESVIGYHTVQRMNDEDQPSTASYNTQSYSRSLFGRTSSGQIVLITVDMGNDNAVGTKHDETNAVLKHYGCVEAYQMDGGSSVAAVGRDENGKIVVIDHPKGYTGNSTRAVLSALLVVERRTPEYNVELVDIDQTTAKFKVDLVNDYHREIKRVYIKINDKDYEVVDGYVEVTGLRKNKEYNWNLCFEDNTGSDYRTESKGVIETPKDPPVFNGCDAIADNTYMVYTVDFTDRGGSLLEYSIITGSNKNTVTDMTVTQVAAPLSNEVVYLEYVYSKGKDSVTVRIKWPHYKCYQVASKISNMKKEALDDFFN